MSGPAPLGPADELLHLADPGEWSWNESWFFSFIDHDGGPAGFFRVGVLPNQGRAMLWGFVHAGDEWVGVEESRLALDHLDLADGVAYDRWALRFAWRPDPPLGGARFALAGEALVRSGPRAGRWVPVEVALDCQATGDAVPTGTGEERDSPYRSARFEQPLAATGTVTIDGARFEVRAGAHRDRSWGPREWRQMFTLGDLQAPGRQLYFVGRTFPGLGMAFVRDGDDVRHLLVTDGAVDFDDEHRTIGSAWLHLEGEGGPAVAVTMRPITPSVSFDMAHTCDPPERWPYWRCLVEAQVSGWEAPCRGWFETSRYGVA